MLVGDLPTTMQPSGDKVTFETSGLFDNLAAAGSNSVAFGTFDKATRALQKSKLAFVHALELENKSATALAQISDNVTPLPVAMEILRQFRNTVIQVVGLSCQDNRPDMLATLADYLSEDPCGEQSFPQDPKWWEPNPQFVSPQERKKIEQGFRGAGSSAKMKIWKKGQTKALTRKPTPLQILCKDIQQQCYTMIRAALPLLEQPRTLDVCLQL